MANATIPELDGWELGELKSYIATQCLQYMGHYATSGLFRAEVATMNRWLALEAKLSEKEPPEPHPYIGYVRNRWNPDAD